MVLPLVSSARKCPKSSMYSPESVNVSKVIAQEMPEKLAEEADFTLNGVNDVERFLKWLSQTAVELS